MININPYDGGITGGNNTYPWYWGIANATPTVLDTSMKVTDATFIVNSLTAIVSNQSVGTGIIEWGDSPLTATPVMTDARPTDRLYGDGDYWLATGAYANTWGEIYSGTIDLSFTEAYAVQGSDGSYVSKVDHTPTFVYWSDNTKSILPTTPEFPIRFRDDLIFADGNVLMSRKGRIQFTRLSGWIRPLLAFQLFGKPWLCYYHQTDSDFESYKGVVVIHPYDDVTRGCIVARGVVTGFDARIISSGSLYGQLVVAWATTESEHHQSIYRKFIPFNDLQTTNLSTIAPTFTMKTGKVW